MGLESLLAPALNAVKGGVASLGASADTAVAGLKGDDPASLVIGQARGDESGFLKKVGAFAKGGDKEDPAQGFDSDTHHEQMLNSGPFLEAQQLANHWDTVAAQRTASLSIGFGHNHLLQ